MTDNEPMTRNTMRVVISNLQLRLATAIQNERRARHELAVALEAAKRTEDVVVAEIWQRADLKNDRDRNSAKHLARINDSRLIDAQTAITNAARDLAGEQARVLAFQADLQMATVDYEFVMLGRRDALMQFALRLAMVAQADTTLSPALRGEASIYTPPEAPEVTRQNQAAADALAVDNATGQPAGRGYTGCSDSPGFNENQVCTGCGKHAIDHAPDVVAKAAIGHAESAVRTFKCGTGQGGGSLRDVIAEMAEGAGGTGVLPTSRPSQCATCGEAMVIAQQGIRKGLPVHGISTDDALHCPANAGSMMNPAHPDFFKPVSDEKGLVNTLAELGRFEHRRVPYHVQAAQEKAAERVRLAENLVAEGKAGWLAVGATQHFFGADGLALGVEGHKNQIINDNKETKYASEPITGVTICKSCHRAAIEQFMVGHPAVASAAYGKPDEDAVLLPGGDKGKGKKVERVKGFQI